MRVDRAAVLALLSGVAFLVCMVLGALHLTDGLDDVARHATNPGGQWGAPQQQANRIAEMLGPAHLLALLALACMAVAGRSRSWRPLSYFCALVAPGVGIELALKWLLPRVDRQGELGHTGGSFPSGHMFVAVICSGGVVLLLTTRLRWWHWIVAAIAPAVVGVTLMIAVVHWASDVVGGALLGTSLLALSAFARERPRPGTSSTCPQELGDSSLNPRARASDSRE